MAKKAQKSKFFRVATEGATTDGRKIEKKWLQEMAATYNPTKYGARIFIEHIRGMNPNAEAAFRCMGDVTALEVRDVEDGKVALFAQISPTDEMVKLVGDRQKIYGSIEVAENFANSGMAYLVGLGITDSPASLGTDILEFAAKNPAANPFSARKQNKENLFSAAVELELEFEEVEDEGPSLLERIKGMFKTQRANDTARFADVHAAVEEIAGVAIGAEEASSQATADLVTLRQEFSDYRAATDTKLQEFTTRLDNTPEPPAPRAKATGGNGEVQTDC